VPRRYRCQSASPSGSTPTHFRHRCHGHATVGFDSHTFSTLSPGYPRPVEPSPGSTALARYAHQLTTERTLLTSPQASASRPRRDNHGQTFVVAAELTTGPLPSGSHRRPPTACRPRRQPSGSPLALATAALRFTTGLYQPPLSYSPGQAFANRPVSNSPACQAAADSPACRAAADLPSVHHRKPPARLPRHPPVHHRPLPTASLLSPGQAFANHLPPTHWPPTCLRLTGCQRLALRSPPASNPSG